MLRRYPGLFLCAEEVPGLGTAFYGDLDTIKAANLEKRKRESRGSSDGGAQKEEQVQEKGVYTQSLVKLVMYGIAR